MSKSNMTWMRRGAALAVVFSVAASAALAETEYEKLLSEKAPAQVTVKFVPKTPDGQQGSEREITGLMVSADGLVLTSSLAMGQNPYGMSIVPTDIKVMIGDDREGLEAISVNVDKERDLAWLQIVGEIKQPLAFVDLKKSDSPAPGTRVLSMMRMNRYFDYAQAVFEGRISGVTKKPRKLLIPTDDLIKEPGLPIFLPDGVFVGVVVVQIPDPEAMAASGQQLRPAAMIMPAKIIATQTEIAAESIPQAKAEWERKKAEEQKAAEEAAAQPKEGETTDEQPADEGDVESVPMEPAGE